MRRLLPFAILLMAAGLLPCRVAAQLYQPRPRPVDVQYRHFSAPPFRLIYQVGLYEEAGAMARLLEASAPEMRARIGLDRRSIIPVVLNRFTDRSNGFVTPRPLRIEIEGVPLRGNTLSPRFRDWHETVAPHELAHALHAESGRGVGVGWLLRYIGPDLARSLNLSAPRGINEGLAVWLESRVRPGAGRLNHSMAGMEFRAAMDSSNPWSLVQMLEPPAYTRPFDRYYIGGAHLFEYLAVDGDIPFFRRARDIYYRFPLLGFGPPLWLATGRRPWRLTVDLQERARTEGRAVRDSLGEVTRVRTLASAAGSSFRRPVWLRDGSLLTYARSYHDRPGFYRVDVQTGVRHPVAVQSITEDVQFTLDDRRSSVLFSRYVIDRLHPERALADVFRLDVVTGEVERVTTDERVFAPVAVEGGGFWALRNVDRFNEWVRIGPSGEVDVVGAVEGTRILALHPDPQSHDVAVVAHRDGWQGIYRARVDAGRLTRFEPWMQFADGSIYDASWSADGRHMLFSADPGGVVNVFAWIREEDRVVQVTNAAYGAFEPALSPDGSTLAFVHYRHERYDLAAIPFDAGGGRSWSEASVSRFEGPPPTIVATTGAASADGSEAEENAGGTAYMPIANLRPRAAYPFVVYQRPSSSGGGVHLGFGGGVGLEWADPLALWTAHTNLFYQNRALWGRAELRSSDFLLRPSAEIYRTPSTVVVRRNTSQGMDTLRVGREEYGAGVAVHLPVVLRSNVFRTAIAGGLAAFVRSERLFDGRGDTVRGSERRVTLRPFASLSYRMQANPRDLQPNTGTHVAVRSSFDVWSERNRMSRWLRVDASTYLPFLRRGGTAIKVSARLLAQNGGGLIDLTTFYPRGYEIETIFLDAGTFGTAGLELTRALWYVDDGFVLPPVFVKALFVYGFAESMQGITGHASRRSTVGAGLGIQLRLFHNIDLTLRAAPVYRLEPSDWFVTFR
ncbi:MAG: hypothetical protein WD021_04730 [Rhodothermales bacterium]